MKDDIEAFSGGIDKEHHTWLNSVDGILSYDEYVDLIRALLENMTEDLGSINKDDFVSDMQYITDVTIKNSKNFKSVPKHNDITTP